MEYRVVRNTNDDELYHYGVKGMKWGVHRFYNKDGSRTAVGKKRENEAKRKDKPSKAQRDVRKLADTATKYYDASNSINSWLDSGAGANTLKNEYKDLVKYHKKTEKLVKKLNKKYKNVSAIPEFDKNGYVVKTVEASLTKLDRKGRIRSANKASTPVETYDHRFGGSKEREKYVSKRNDIMKKYKNKIDKAKTERERAELEFELLDELDEL